MCKSPHEARLVRTDSEEKMQAILDKNGLGQFAPKLVERGFSHSSLGLLSKEELGVEADAVGMKPGHKVKFVCAFVVPVPIGLRAEQVQPEVSTEMTPRSNITDKAANIDPAALLLQQQQERDRQDWLDRQERLDRQDRQDRLDRLERENALNKQALQNSGGNAPTVVNNNNIVQPVVAPVAPAAPQVVVVQQTPQAPLRQQNYCGPMTMCLWLFVPCICWCPVDTRMVPGNTIDDKHCGPLSCIVCLATGFCCIGCCPIDKSLK